MLGGRQSPVVQGHAAHGFTGAAGIRTRRHVSTDGRNASGFWDLIHHTELQVRCGDLEDDVLVALDQRHPSVMVSVGATDSMEFDIDFEVGAVSADECTLQSC